MNENGQINATMFEFNKLKRSFINSPELKTISSLKSFAHEFAHVAEMEIRNYKEADKITYGFEETMATLFEYLLIEFLYEKNYITTDEYLIEMYKQIVIMYGDAKYPTLGLYVAGYAYNHGIFTEEDLKEIKRQDAAAGDLTEDYENFKEYDPEIHMMYLKNRYAAYKLHKVALERNISLLSIIEIFMYSSETSINDLLKMCKIDLNNYNELSSEFKLLAADGNKILNKLKSNKNSKTYRRK